MIIRITVEDNDFAQVLEKFTTPMFKALLFGRDKPEDMDPETWYQSMYLPHARMRELLNPNITESLSDEDKDFICTEICKLWEEHVAQRYSDDQDYLKRAFKASISYAFEDKWENGEAVYFFTTAQKYITQ